MTARITSRQKEQAKKLVGDTLTSLNPTKDGMQRVLMGKAFQMRFRQLVVELVAEFYVLLSDDEAVAWLVEYAKKVEAEARQSVNGIRQKARAAGMADTVKIHAEVQPGCLFKRDMPQMGPCWEEFKYLQGWDFPDPPTEHVLVSLIPAPLAGSTSKDISEQAAMIATFKAEALLPDWYDVSFGSVNHVGGMALAHFNATGRDPFNGLIVRTDTCLAGGRRLRLHWFGGRLCCGYWDWDDGERGSDVGVFALGVVKALGR